MTFSRDVQCHSDATGMSKGKPQDASILSFFTRTPGPKPLGSETGGKRRRSAVDEDVKPVVGRDRSSKTANGKALGVEENPVVISDSDEDVTVSPSLLAAGKKRHRASSSVKHSAGSVSTTGAPTAFPSFPDFKPPSTWPEIVNTASNPYELDQAEDELASVIPPETPPVPSRSNSTTASTILGVDEWDEGDDEGMGMDDGDDYRGEDPDEGDDVSEIVPVEPPKRILSTGDKAPTCPICGKSMKGKGSAVSAVCYRKKQYADCRSSYSNTSMRAWTRLARPQLLQLSLQQHRPLILLPLPILHERDHRPHEPQNQ